MDISWKGQRTNEALTVEASGKPDPDEKGLWVAGSFFFLKVNAKVTFREAGFSPTSVHAV